MANQKQREAERLLQAVEDEATGLDLLASLEQTDNESIVRCLARQLRQHHEDAEVVKQAAEALARRQANEVEQANETAAEYKGQVARLTKELKDSNRQVFDFQARIAFLGTQWEKLTGDVNTLHVENPQVEFRALNEKIQEQSTALFNAELAAKGLDRELRAERDNSKIREDLLQKWTVEITSTRARCEALVTENRNLNNEIERLNGELFQAHTQRKELEDELKETRRQKNLLRAHNTEVESRLDRTERSLKHTNLQLKDEKEEHQETDFALRQKMSDLKGLESEFDETSANLKDLRDQFAKMKTRATQAEAKGVRLENTLEQKRRQVDTLSSLLTEERGSVTHWRMETSHFDRKLQTSEAEGQALRHGMEKSTTDLISVQARLKDKETHADRLKAELQASDASLARLNAEHNDLSRMHRKTHFDLRAVRGEKEGLQTTGNILASNLKKTESSLNTAGLQIAELDASAKKFGSEWSTALLDLEQARAKIKRLEEEVSNSRARCVSLANEVADWKGRYSKTMTNLSTSRANLQDRDAAYTKLTREAKATTLHLHSAQDSNEGMKGDVTRFLGDLQGKEQTLQESNMREEGLKATLKTVRGELKAAERRVKELETSTNVLKIKLNDALAGKAAAGEETKMLTSDLSKADKQIAHSEEDLDALRQAIGRITDERNQSQARADREFAIAAGLKKDLARMKNEVCAAEAAALQSQIAEHKMADQFASARAQPYWGESGKRAREMDFVLARQTVKIEEAADDVSLLRRAVTDIEQQLCDEKEKAANIKGQSEGLRVALGTEREKARRAQEAREIAERHAKFCLGDLEAMKQQVKMREASEHRLLRELGELKVINAELKSDKEQLFTELTAMRTSSVRE